jgi:molecular chaperone HtpG
MQATLEKGQIDEAQMSHASLVVKELRARLKRRGVSGKEASPLDRLPAPRRKFYQQMFQIIYECAANKTVAKALIDRILEKAS